MGGLGILIVIAMYIALAIFVVRKTPTRWGKAIAVFAVVLLPTGDALWGRYVTLPKLCQDAGLRVFKHASKADGLLLDIGANDYWINRYGIAFIEGSGSGKFYRMTISNEKTVIEQNVQPQAKYLFKVFQINQYSNYGGEELRIEDRQTGQTVAWLRTYGFRGGWVERFLGGFAGSGPQSGAGCHLNVPYSMEILIKETFK